MFVVDEDAEDEKRCSKLRTLCNRDAETRWREGGSGNDAMTDQNEASNELARLLFPFFTMNDKEFFETAKQLYTPVLRRQNLRHLFN